MTTVEKVYLNRDNSLPQPNWRWWTEKDDSIHSHVMSMCRTIEGRQRYRADLNLRFARMYANMELRGLSAYQYARIDVTKLPTARVTLNVIKSCIDTAAAKIAKNKPKALFLTEKGDYSAQRRAKGLTQYVAGLLYESKAYGKSSLAFKDAGVFGTGVLKVYQDNDTLSVDRIIPDEIIVDDSDGMYMSPRSIFQRRYIHRDLLISSYPDSAELLCATQRAEYISGNDVSDMLYVVEAWHLPSSKDAGDGKHIIAVDNATLYSEDWDRDYFPFAFFRWSERLLGFYGSGIAEELLGLQIEINKLLRDISSAQHLIGVPRIFTQAGSTLGKPITNGMAEVYPYTGAIPTFHTAPSMSADIYQHLEKLYQRAFEIVGISQLSATSRKPAGLDSGVALREYNDIETERFILVGQAYEQFHLDLAKIMIDMTRRMQEDGLTPSAKTKSGKFIETINWKEVNLDDDKFTMQAFPTSLLPSTPSGRLQTVTELVQSGFIQKDQAMSLLDFPDVEEFLTLANASQDSIKLAIENILDKGRYTAPEPFMNLQTALMLGQANYLKAWTDGVPEEKLELLRRFISECLRMLQPPPVPMTPQGPMPTPQIPSQNMQPQTPAQATPPMSAPVQ